MSNTLPDSRARTGTGARFDAESGMWAEPCYCMNCGKRAGFAVGDIRHIAVLCDPCGEKYGAAGAEYVAPDSVYFAAAREEQMERYGRLLSPSELAIAVTEEHHPLALIARDLSKPPARRA